MLKPSKYHIKNINLCTFDIETDYPDNPEDILIIGFYNGEKYFCFNNMDTFLGECLKSKYYNYNIYAHNGGRFDFKFLLEGLNKYDYDFDILDVNGNILQISVKMQYYRNKNDVLLPKYKINFRDSYMLLKDSLYKITHSFSDKVKYVKIEHDFNNQDKEFFTCLKHKKLNCLECYNEYDVIGLYESIKYFENVLHKYNGNIKLTIASTALSIFKNNYLKNYIYSINKDIKLGNYLGKDIIINIENEFRKYYVGGRTEIFKRYGEYLYYYDINSLYPFIMRENSFPISNPIFVLPEQISKNDKGFFFCEINYPSEKCKSGIPLLPMKIFGSHYNKLIYPTGSWKAMYDSDMLEYAKKIGYDIKIEYGFIFDYEKIFEDFIDDFYKLRKENESYNIIFKYLMNGSYGKFAQKRKNKSIVKINNPEMFKQYKNIEPYIDEFNLYKVENEINSTHIIPSISNRVTQLAQLEIYKWYEKVNFDVYNTDTDSFITSEKLNTSNNLGDIKLEYEIDRGIFLFPKFYCFEGFDLKNNDNVTIKKMKGFSKGIDKINFDDFYNALFNNDFSKFNIHYNDLWGFKESLNRKNTFLTYDRKTKSIQSDYDKRILLNDKINTNPLKVYNEIIVNR